MLPVGGLWRWEHRLQIKRINQNILLEKILPPDFEDFILPEAPTEPGEGEET